MSDFREEEKLGKVYDAQITRRLMKYLWPYRWMVVVAMLMTLLIWCEPSSHCRSSLSPWLALSISAGSRSRGATRTVHGEDTAETVYATATIEQLAWWSRALRRAARCA